jgi:hypothetical protein
MEFQRGQDPITTMDLGYSRKLKKGDGFILIIPAIMGSYGMNPQREERAIATEAETSHKHWYTEKVDSFGQVERDFYEVRQVRWEIFEVASGWAEMRCNCEFPRWTLTMKPEFEFSLDNF